LASLSREPSAGNPSPPKNLAPTILPIFRFFLDAARRAGLNVFCVQTPRFHPTSFKSMSLFLTLSPRGEPPMRFVIAFALLAGIALLSGNGLYSQEKKDTKVKGILPPGWTKLELTAEQKAAIYKVQAKYKEDIAKLEEKVKEAKAEERKEMVQLLTPEQKKKLLDLATGETTKKDDKK
jgi:hypothetical protein